MTKRRTLKLETLDCEQTWNQALVYIRSRQSWTRCPKRPNRLAVIIPAASPIKLPSSMSRGSGTFMETEGHDWTWDDVRGIRYHGTETLPCWFLIEYSMIEKNDEKTGTSDSDNPSTCTSST